MKILAIGASTSSTSINRRLANYAANQIPDAVVTDFNLGDIDVPIFSEDEEKSNGYPADIYRFLYAIQSHDGVVISLAEHNGSYSAAFKNIYDWASRIQQKVWSGKPMLLLSTSPGGRGGKSVMASAQATFPRMGAELKATFSLPKFYGSFSDGGITDAELRSEFEAALAAFVE